MEKGKRNLSLGILIGLLLGIIGFLVYYIFIQDKSTTSISDDSIVESSESSLVGDGDSSFNNSYKYSLSKRKNVQIEEFRAEGYWFYMFVDLSGNVYLQINDNKGQSSAISEIKEKYKTYTIDGYINHDGTSFENAFKLDINNVLFVENSHLGNGDNSYCIFVLENGEIAYLNYFDLALTGDVTVKKIDGLSNIVTVISDSSLPYVVDIDGNEYMLSDYIK